MKLGCGLLAMLAALACQPTEPVRDCSGCFYSFADTVLPRTAVVFHWPASRLPIRVFADPRGAMPSLVSHTIATWQAQFLYGEFQGQLASDSNHADVIVTWTGGVPANVPPDAGPPVPACAGSTDDPATSLGSSIENALHVVLTSRAGFTDGQVAACLQRVAVHEMGHALGLLRESDSSSDIMYEDPLVATPSDRDRHTVELLYHTAATIVPPPAP